MTRDALELAVVVICYAATLYLIGYDRIYILPFFSTDSLLDGEMIGRFASS